MIHSGRAELRQHIVMCARQLFADRGVRGVTMSDVAHRSGCSRQMVYKVFFDRRELVLAAAVERIMEIADIAASRSSGPEALVSAAQDAMFAHSFVELSVHVIETLRSDPELVILFGEGSPVTFHEALWEPELTERALRFWFPWLEWGRANGVLRTDLSNRDLADWLHTVYASIILRRNIPQEEERSMIERFVLTSLAMATVGGERNDVVR